MNANQKALKDALQVLVSTPEIRQFLEDNDPQALKQAEKALVVELKFKIGDYIYHSEDRKAYLEGVVVEIRQHEELGTTYIFDATGCGRGILAVEFQDEWEKQ